jgi:hypothetical protein
MRRLLLASVLLVALPTLAGCRAPREDARRQFTEQLEQEGGLPHAVAVCIVDKFFEERTTEELKAFFERKDLTAQESAEFRQLSEQCAVLDTTPVTAAGA